MTRIQLLTFTDIHQAPDWFPKLRKEGYRQFEVSMSPDGTWTVSGILFPHLIEKPPKKSRT